MKTVLFTFPNGIESFNSRPLGVTVDERNEKEKKIIKKETCIKYWEEKKTEDKKRKTTWEAISVLCFIRFNFPYRD